MKKFILKINGWNFDYFVGTIDEMKKTLNSVGAEVVRTEESDYNDFGILFNKKLTAKIKCIGYDSKLQKLLSKEIVSLCKSKGVKADSYERCMIEDFTKEICRRATIEKELLTIYVSDGEIKKEKNVVYLSNRDYVSFKDFSKKSFWEMMESHGYVRKP